MLSSLNRFFKRNNPERQPLITKNSDVKLTFFDSKENIGLLNELPAALSLKLLLFLYDDEIALLSITSLYFYQQCSNFFDSDSIKIIRTISAERRPTEYTKVLLLENKDSLYPLQKNENTIYLAPPDNNLLQQINVYWYSNKNGLRNKTISSQRFNKLKLPSFPRPEEPPVIINRIQNSKLVDQIALKCDCDKRPTWKKSQQRMNLDVYIKTQFSILPAGKRLPYLVPLFFVVTGSLYLTSYFIIEPEYKNNFLKFSSPLLLGIVGVTGWGTKRLLKLKRLETLYSPSRRQNFLAFFNRMERRFEDKTILLENTAQRDTVTQNQHQ